MATIDDERARLLAGQARRMKADAHEAAELLRCGKTDEAAQLLDRNRSYANFIAAELEDLTRPLPGVPIRGKSRRR